MRRGGRKGGALFSSIAQPLPPALIMAEGFILWQPRASPGFDGWIQLVREEFETEDQAIDGEKGRLHAMGHKMLGKLEASGVHVDAIRLGFECGIVYSPPEEGDERLWAIDHFKERILEYVASDAELAERLLQHQKNVHGVEPRRDGTQTDGEPSGASGGRLDHDGLLRLDGSSPSDSSASPTSSRSSYSPAAAGGDELQYVGGGAMVAAPPMIAGPGRVSPSPICGLDAPSAAPISLRPTPPPSSPARAPPPAARADVAAVAAAAATSASWPAPATATAPDAASTAGGAAEAASDEGAPPTALPQVAAAMPAALATLQTAWRRAFQRRRAQRSPPRRPLSSRRQTPPRGGAPPRQSRASTRQ